jgi:hypothetical protein
MKPNIFEIATKELHQDAFITWLLQYADDKYKSSDILMNECGKDFVSELIRKHIPEFNEEITKVEAGRQWENIDVWAEVNDKYLIIIEDKINTIHHSNQLYRYKTIAEEWCTKHNYNKPICIYLKTRNESQETLTKAKKEGFEIFNRQDFTGILSKHEKSDNDIFKDFYQRLIRIEKSNNEFESRIIAEWKGSDWEGFFQFLEKEIGLIGWNYVNNPNGGFWNAVLNWEYWGDYPVYIQTEEGKLCFKISTDPEEDIEIPNNSSRGQIRNEFSNIVINNANDLGIANIRKPDRFGNGKYMTVAIVEQENWLGESNSTIDKGKVIETLKKYKVFLTTIVLPIINE